MFALDNAGSTLKYAWQEDTADHRWSDVITRRASAHAKAHTEQSITARIVSAPDGAFLSKYKGPCYRADPYGSYPAPSLETETAT